MFNTNSLIILGLLILLLCLNCSSATCCQILLAVTLASTFTDCNRLFDTRRPATAAV